MILQGGLLWQRILWCIKVPCPNQKFFWNWFWGTSSMGTPPPLSQQNHTIAKHLHSIVEHPTTMDDQQSWQNCAKGQAHPRPELQMDQVGDECQLTYRTLTSSNNVNLANASQDWSTGPSQQGEYILIAGSWQKRWHQFGVPPHASELGHGHQNCNPNPTTTPCLDDTPFVFRWHPRPLQIHCHLQDALQLENCNNAQCWLEPIQALWQKPTSCPPTRILWWHDPLCWRFRVDCQHSGRPTRHNSLSQSMSKKWTI